MRLGLELSLAVLWAIIEKSICTGETSMVSVHNNMWTCTQAALKRQPGRGPRRIRAPGSGKLRIKLTTAKEITRFLKITKNLLHVDHFHHFRTDLRPNPDLVMWPGLGRSHDMNLEFWLEFFWTDLSTGVGHDFIATRYSWTSSWHVNDSNDPKYVSGINVNWAKKKKL